MKGSGTRAVDSTPFSACLLSSVLADTHSHLSSLSASPHCLCRFVAKPLAFTSRLPLHPALKMGFPTSAAYPPLGIMCMLS
eukprot:414334-Pelagomonas_calceolata.AAC.4